MRLLFIGDIVGKSGRQAFSQHIASLREQHQTDMVVVNCENSAAGFGVTEKIATMLLNLGSDVLTSGNHIWDRREIISVINKQPRLIRPLNYPPGTPGKGYVIVKVKQLNVAVVNLMGQVFMGASLNCPFQSIDRLLEEIKEQADIILVDFHAEASSEKQALARHLDGRVSAVMGTHTHVPTADERILSGGTAYISDVGMTGCYKSIIGMKIETSLARFLSKMPQRLEVANGPAELHGVLINIDESTAKAQSIARICVAAF